MEKTKEANGGGLLKLANDTKPLLIAARDGATDSELAAIFGVPVAALSQFEAVLLDARAQLACRVRRAMLAAADRGNDVALTWLAKRYLEGAPPAEKSDFAALAYLAKRYLEGKD